MTETQNVSGQMTNMLNPIEATITDKIVKNSLRGVPVTMTPTIEPRDPINKALIRVSAFTVLNNTYASFVFPNNMGLIVPKCSAVLRRPAYRPPIAPLMLRIPGYIIRAHGIVSNMPMLYAISPPAINPVKLNSREKSACAVDLRNS